MVSFYNFFSLFNMKTIIYCYLYEKTVRKRERERERERELISMKHTMIDREILHEHEDMLIQKQYHASIS